MFCPMMFNNTDGNGIKCVRAECAWWDEEQGMCCIPDMAKSLDFILERVSDISAVVEHMG